MSLLSAVHVSHHYQGRSFLKKQPPTAVLDDINLEIEPGEAVALLGQSGSGKSTLARLLSALEKPTQGQILYSGQSTKQMSQSEQDSFHRDVQMVFQDSLSAVNPRRAVFQIIAEPLHYLANITEKARRERVNRLLVQVNLSPNDGEKLPSQMSGGQLQRVCIARALALNPKLVILDEALSSQDLVLQSQLLKMLKEIQCQSETAWLFVTHDLRIAKQFCHRALIMDNGKIVERSRIDEPFIFQHPAAIALQNAILPAKPPGLD